MAEPERNVTSIDGKQLRPELNVELGVSPITPGGMPWGLPNTDADTSTVLNKPIVTVQQLTDMRRRDGQAKALTQLVTLPIRMALQTGEWIDPDDKGETKEAEFANQLWNLPPNAGGMTTSKTKLIRQLLLGLTDGFSAFEVVRHVPERGPLKGKVTLRKLAYRDPNTVQFLVDKNGGYKGFRQVTQLADMDPVDVVVPPAKSLVWTCHDEVNPLYGVSLFESAYPHWDAKRKLYYIAHLAAQFAAVPGRLGHYPSNPEGGPQQIAEFRNALQNFAFNTAMLVPEGFKVEPFNGNSGYDFLRLIDHHNTQMSKSILANFFDSEQRTVLIENSASHSTDADLFLMSMETIAADIAETLSVHLMPQFIDFNFNGADNYPVFRPGDLNDQTKDSIRDMFDKVVVSGILNSTPEFVRELEKGVATNLNLGIDYDEIEEREKEAAEAQAQAPQGPPQGPPQPGDPEQAAEPQEAPPGSPEGESEEAAAPPEQQTPNAEEVATSATGIDELVQAAQALFLSARPDDDPDPVDGGV